jgi:hypothetical protein
MLYINDPNFKPILYIDLVNAVIKAGIEPRRAYMYLASLGIKSGNTRQTLPDLVHYGEIRKLAVNSDTGNFVTSYSICSECGLLNII